MVNPVKLPVDLMYHNVSVDYPCRTSGGECEGQNTEQERGHAGEDEEHERPQTQDQQTSRVVAQISGWSWIHGVLSVRIGNFILYMTQLLLHT